MAVIKTDELSQFQEHGVYIPARIIALFGEIDEESASKFIKSIRLLDFLSDKDIRVLVNTPGGEVHQGLAIIDAIRECQSRVIGHVVGPCWSMGAAILQSFDKRLISYNATLMIHMGDISIEDHTENTKRWMGEYDRVGEIYESILFKKIKRKIPSFTKTKLKKMLAFDSILNAEEAVEYGLADEIVDHKDLG